MSTVDQLSPDFVAAYANWLGVTEGEAYRLLKNEPLRDVTDRDMTAAGWDESEHPRYPEGDERGGQFRPKEGSDPTPDEWIEAVRAGRFFGDYTSYLAAQRAPKPEQPEQPATPESATDALGSDRDPGWEADPIQPEPAEFGGMLFSGIENSDLVWSGQTNPLMQYQLDKGYYLDSLGAQGDEANLDEHLADYRAETESMMRSIGEEGDLRIQTPLNLMGQILDDGRFKSQFEVPYSQGAFLPAVRAAQEEMFFGYPQDMPPDRRPIYGWLEHPDAEAQEHILPQYGEVTWGLKPELKSRTTVSFLDSLSRPVVPGPIANPGWRATVPPGYDDNGSPGIISHHVDESGLFDDVIEAQYHGGVSLEDVANVKIVLDMGPTGNPYDYGPDLDEIEGYIERLKKRGIRVDVADSDGNPIYEDGVYVSPEDM